IYVKAGKRNEAQKILDEMFQRSKREEISPFYVAAVYIALGDKEHGMEWLEKAYEERAELLVFLKVAPNFDAVHSDPRFIQIMQGSVSCPKRIINTRSSASCASRRAALSWRALSNSTTMSSRPVNWRL